MDLAVVDCQGVRVLHYHVHHAVLPEHIHGALEVGTRGNRPPEDVVAPDREVRRTGTDDTLDPVCQGGNDGCGYLHI